MVTQGNITLPAPEIAMSPVPENKWRREYEAFQRLLPDLLRTPHLGQFVVIHDGQVVDSGTDDLALALRFFAQHGNVPIHIGLVTAAAVAPVRVPHYRATAVKGIA